jgi:hypothetical protein
MPRFPKGQDLDQAWAYAMNEAVAHRMVFGRDVIFTFGPYASAYTWMYHPKTDRLMFAADTLIGLAVAIGALALATRGRMAYLLPLPVVVYLSDRDASFLILPLLFLLICIRITLPKTHKWKLIENWQVVAVLLTIMLALSLIMLVKGTFAVMSGSVAGLGWLLLLRSRPRWALALGVVFVTGLVGFWLAAHQPVWALPGFFLAQMSIISGYSDAMSTALPPAPVAIILYGISASLLLLAGVLSFGRGAGLPGRIMCVGLAFALFLVFKASFVRNPATLIGARLIGASFVLLAAFILATSLPHWTALIVIAGSITAWVPTAGGNVWNRIASVQKFAFRQLVYGVQARTGFGQDLRQQFAAARAKICQENPLTRVDGGADIYPFSQDILLASRLEWSPRPIVQSYSAYEPKLADINAEHLLGISAPRNVFFDVCPIDNRLATLEDGKSWPLLLTRYRIVGRAGHFLVLERNHEAGNDPKMLDISVSRQRIGQEFNLPRTSEPVWAEINVRPTFLGQIFSALFKPPQLHVLFRFEDGHTETYRYIAAMGRSGFIISPVIHDAN